MRHFTVCFGACGLGYTLAMLEILIALSVLLLLLAGWLAWRIAAVSRRLEALPGGMAQGLEEKHRAMLTDLHGGLTQQGDRLGTNFSESSERLRGALAEELRQTRDTLHGLKLSLSENLGQSREAMVKQLAQTTDQLNAKIDQRLEQISGKVSDRGFLVGPPHLPVHPSRGVPEPAVASVHSLCGA